MLHSPCQECHQDARLQISGEQVFFTGGPLACFYLHCGGPGGKHVTRVCLFLTPWLMADSPCLNTALWRNIPEFLAFKAARLQEHWIFEHLAEQSAAGMAFANTGTQGMSSHPHHSFLFFCTLSVYVFPHCSHLALYLLHCFDLSACKGQTLWGSKPPMWFLKNS